MTNKNINTVVHKTRDIYLDAVKGILILCIVLEHNSLLTSNHDWIRPFSDAFAAGCFLIFTFIWPIKSDFLINFLNKKFSYWWPFVLFVTITSLLNHFLFSSTDFTASIEAYLKAISLASPKSIKESSGFMYFWFLPCLCILYLIRLIAIKVGHTFYLISIPAWLFIGVIDDDTLISTPFSLHVIAFIFFIGQIFSITSKVLIKRNNKIQFCLIILFIILSIASYYVGWKLFLAAGNIPSVDQPMLLLFYSVFMLITIPAIYQFTNLLPNFIVAFFSYLGDNSLIIYLFHPIVYILITQIIPIITHPLLSLLATVIICIVISYLIKRINILNKIIFPNKLSNLLLHRKL